MFQYAAGKALAEHHGTELKIDISAFKEYNIHDYSLDKLAISASVATDDETAPFLNYKPPSNRILKIFFKKFDFFVPYKGKKVFFEPYFDFNKRFFELPADICLNGYFQSEKYFKRIESVIRKEFVLREDPSVACNELADGIINNANSVSIHFRRGNYITNQGINKIFGVPPLKYYYSAVEKIVKVAKDPCFYVFSNDIEWVKNNFKLAYPTIYVTNPLIKDHEEVVLMSKCRYNIIANSSFSWWGAWLNNNPDKIVVAPARWFVWKSITPKDILPSNWLKV